MAYEHTTKSYSHHDTTTTDDRDYHTTKSYNHHDTTTTDNRGYHTTSTTTTSRASYTTPPPYYSDSTVTVTYNSNVTSTDVIIMTSEVDSTMTVLETMTEASGVSYSTIVYQSVQTFVTVTQFVSVPLTTCPISKANNLQSLMSTNLVSIEIETTSEGPSATVTYQVFTTQTALGIAPSGTSPTTGLPSSGLTTSPPIPFTGAGISQLNMRGGIAASVAALVGVLAWLL
jgi:hypothetical protein